MTKYAGAIELYDERWHAQPEISNEDQVRISMLRELDYCFLRINEDHTDVSHDSDFEEYDRIYCLNNLPKGMYEIGSDNNLYYLGGLE